MLFFDFSPCLDRRPLAPAPTRLGWASLILILTCTACAPVPPAPVTPPPLPEPTIVHVPVTAPEDAAARHMLAYQATLSTLAPADLAREITKLSEANNAGTGSPQDSMDLALALGRTHTPGDLVRAQSLLDKLLANGSDEAKAWHPLARWLASFYADQRRLEEQVERLSQQLRDAQRDNQRKLDQLNDKLEALKSIERSLNSRTLPASPAPSAAAPNKPATRP